jgi:hypothetical protein
MVQYYYVEEEWYPVIQLIAPGGSSYAEQTPPQVFTKAELARIRAACQEFTACANLIRKRFGVEPRLAYSLLCDEDK